MIDSNTTGGEISGNDSTTSTNSSNGNTSTTAEARLFQEAYQKMAQLRRVEEQLVVMKAKKVVLVEELRTAQHKLNDEIGKLIESVHVGTSTSDSEGTMEMSLDDSSLTGQSVAGGSRRGRSSSMRNGAGERVEAA